MTDRRRGTERVEGAAIGGGSPRRNRRRALLGGAMTLLCATLALGCAGTKVVSGGPFSGVVQTPEGTLRYSLAKTVVVVEANVTKGTSGRVTFDGNEFTVDTKLGRTDATAQVSFQAAVDEDQFFTLRLEHGSASDDAVAIEISPNGLLQTVGLASTSQVGSTIKNVATIAASVAAGIAAAALSGDPRKKAAALVCEQLGRDAGTPGRCPILQPAAPPPPATLGPKLTKKGTSPADPTPPAQLAGCDKRTETSLAELSMANLYFLAKSQKHRRLWLDVRAAETLLGERTCRRAELERAAERAATRELEEARIKIEAARDLEAAARVDLRTASEELDTAVRSFQLETGIDAPARTETVRMTFDLDQIPPPDMLRKAVAPEPPARAAGMTDAEVRAALKSFPRMLELYDRTGIALTLTPPPYAARGGTVWSGETGDAPKTRIYYRPSYTAVLTTFATTRTADEQGGEQEVLRLSSVASDDVVHPKMPVQGFAFSPEDFTERRLSLAFDPMGRLIRYDQSGSSAAAGASTTAIEALQLARDEYASTLSRIAEIQETQRLVRQNEVLTEIDRLRRQRELLDERLELSGARSSYDLALEKRRIDARLGLLQSRRELADQKQAGVDVTDELAELRARLDQLARDLEALRKSTDRTTSARPTTARP